MKAGKPTIECRETAGALDKTGGPKTPTETGSCTHTENLEFDKLSTANQMPEIHVTLQNRADTRHKVKFPAKMPERQGPLNISARIRELDSKKMVSFSTGKKEPDQAMKPCKAKDGCCFASRVQACKTE